MKNTVVSRIAYIALSTMKKFFLTIFFLVITTVSVMAQVALNNFTVGTTPGECKADAKLNVNLLSTMGPSGTQVQVKLEVPNDPNGKTQALKVGISGQNSYEFTSLKAGIYTVTVIEVATNKKSSPRVVNVTSNYIPPTFKNVLTFGPSCSGSGNDGKIIVTIRGGAKGPFDVKLFKAGAQIYSQRHTKPNAANELDITIGGGGVQMPSGSDYQLVVEDFAGSSTPNPTCGETNKTAITIPPASLSLNCLELELGNGNGIRVGANCKFGLSFSLHRKDNGSLDDYETAIQATGSAIVKAYTAGGTLKYGPVDISSTYRSAWRGNNVAAAYSFITDYVFEEGDVVELSINVGKTPFTKKIKIDRNVVDVALNTTKGNNASTFMVRSGSALISADNRSDIAVPPVPCPTGTELLLAVDFNSRAIELPEDGSTNKVGFQYYWLNGLANNWIANPSSPGAGYYYEIYKYLGSGYPGWDASFTNNNMDETDTTKWQLLSSPIDYTWVNKNYAELTGQPNGYYLVKLVMRDAGGNKFCYSPKRVVEMRPKPTSIGRQFHYIEKDKGIYKNTATLRKWLSPTDFSYPITVKLDLLDGGTGTRTVNFDTALPFENVRSVTYTFPVIKTILSPDAGGDPTSFSFGDLPTGLGDYRITITDACGNTSYRDYNLDDVAMTYTRDVVKAESICRNTSKISYDIATTPNGTLKGALFELFKKDNAGQYSIHIGSSRDLAHTFNNLEPGDYVLQSRGYYYAQIKRGVWKDDNQSGNTGVMNWENFTDTNAAINGWTLVENTDTNNPSNPNHHTGVLHNSRVYLTITPTGELDVDVVGTSCNASANSGLVAIQVKNPEYIRYPLQFLLKRTNGTIVTSSVVFQSASQVSKYVFKNVANGNYVAVLSHACGDIPQGVSVNTNSYSQPGITYSSQSLNPCNGDVMDITFAGSPQLYNIEWFRVETDNSETSIAIDTKTISETVRRDTKYIVRYSLIDATLCAGGGTGVASVTVSFGKDTVKPVITGCPSGTITVNTLANQCYGVATWGVVTATDDCRIDTWSQTHQSGDRFDIGLHTVTYVFKDTSGNVATCSFNVEVKSKAIDMEVKDAFVDGTNGVISNRKLANSESFAYRITYQNKGVENVTSATMEITLPNHPALIIGTPDYSGATENLNAPVEMGRTSNTITLSIPMQTLRAGGPLRTILIPLRLNGDCNEIGKPCMNSLTASYSFKFEGRRPTCVVPVQESTSSKTLEISTDNCVRTEMFCPGTSNVRLTAITGFDQYIWYQDGNLMANPLNNNYVDAPAVGTYRVEKVKNCNGTTLTSTETMQLVDIDNVTDPIRAQANGGDRCGSEDIWVSHFILCNQTSKTITANIRDTRIAWQKLKSGEAPRALNCPETDDNKWETVGTDRDFVISTTAHYRLHLTNAGGDCSKNFYFDVFNSALSGEIDNTFTRDISDYQNGNIRINMATSGLTYKYVLKDSNGNVKATFQGLSSSKDFVISTPDTYTVEVTALGLPSTCKATFTQKIEKQVRLVPKVTAKNWKGCNLRVLNFQAGGGDAPYDFAVWSIDGVILNGYTNYTDVPDTNYIATGIPAGNAGTDRDINIMQPGTYVFLARDAQKAYALTPAIDIYPDELLGYTINTTDIKCGSLSNTGVISITYNTRQNVKSTLYKFDESNNESYIDENHTGYFSNLVAGKYKLKIEVTLGSLYTCTYVNPNLEIKSMDSTLKAYAGVLEDISCDSASPTKQYKVRINNVSGGTGFGYEYSSNNVNYSNNPVLMVGSTVSVVYVRDSNKCVTELPIKIVPIVPPTVTNTAVTYDCDGRGTFTLTTTPSGAFEYHISNAAGTMSETRTNNVFTLNPGVYSIYAKYTPAMATATTPNVLFNEDFGTGLDTCDSDSVFLTCNTAGTALTNNQYVITRQVTANPALWVSPTPTDASGVTDGRYLAINGASPNNDSGVVYKRTIKDVVPNQELNVSVNLFNLIPSSYAGGTNPNLVVRIYNPGNLAQYVEKSIGELQRSNSWVNKKVTFAAAQVAYNSVIFEIRNTAPTSVIGSDLAVDDIKLWQPTKLCAVRSEGISVNVENNRQFKARGTAYDEKCGKNDGEIALVVENAQGATVQYQVRGTTSWTTVTLSATTATQGVATITNLSAVQSGTLYVRKTNEPTCMTSFDYTIKRPTPAVVTATIVAPVTCLDTHASVRFTAEGGAKPYQSFSYAPTGGGTAPATKAAVNNEADFNLEAGTYRIEVKDANGCVTTNTLVVANAKPLRIEVVDLAPCFQGGTTGRLQVKVLEGNGDYQFSKDGGTTFENGSVASGTSIIYEDLTAGLYNIVVRDGGACNASATYTIANPLRIQTVPVTPLNCAPNSRAKFTITYTGGRTGTREFLWSNNATTGFSTAIGAGLSLSSSGNVYTFESSVEGVYYFKVRYLMDNGEYCEVVSDRQEVKVVKPYFTATPTVEDVNCAGANTGKILINNRSIAGGVPPFSILLNNGTLTNTHNAADLVSLPKGVYTLTIVDSAQCKSEPMAVRIAEVPAMVVTTTHTSLACNGSGVQLADITAMVTAGGTAPYKVTLIKNGTAIASRTGVTANDMQTFNGMDIGSYQVLVEDAKGCQFTDDFQVTSEANGLDIRPVSAQCTANSADVAVSVYDRLGGVIGNGQYIAIYKEGMGRPTGSPIAPTVSVIDADGGTTIWYRADPPVDTTLSDGVTVVKASTYTFTSLLGTGLTPGVRYTFAVYDSNSGCSFTKEASAPLPSQSALESQVTLVRPTTCRDADDGKVTFFLKNWGVSGITNYRIYKYPPTAPGFTDPTDHNGSSVTVGGTITHLALPSVGENYTAQGIPAGRYFAVFTDAGTGCVQASPEFTIKRSASQLTASVTVAKKANCKQPQPIGMGRVVVDAQGGQSPYEYYYEGISSPLAPVLSGVTLDNAFTANAHGAARDLISGMYRVYIRDAAGCLVHTITTVDLDPSPAIASVDVLDACSDNSDYPVNVVFATKGVGQHQYKIDGINDWQNLTMPAVASETNVLLPIRLAPNTSSYTLSIRDGNGCETSTTFKVYDYINFEASHTPIVPCGNGAATITVSNITGGTGSYKISLYRVVDRGSSTQRAVPLITADNVTGNSYVMPASTGDGIREGDYRISVYDAATFGTAAECAKTLMFRVAPPEMPRIEVLSVTTPTCYQDEATVRVKVTPVADGPYVFKITAPDGSAVSHTLTANANYATFAGLISGPVSLGGKGYLITAESIRSCTVEKVVTATSPDIVSITAGALTKKDYECEVDDAGYLTGESLYPRLIFDLDAVSGGTGIYERIEFRTVASNTLVAQKTVEAGENIYTYTLPNYLTADTDYYVQVYDSNGCSMTSTVATVSSTLIMSAITASQTQALTCANTGEKFDITVSTTTVYNNEPIEYTITKIGEIAPIITHSATSLTFNNVTITEPGYYVVKAVNKKTSCEVSVNYTVLDPQTLLLEAKDPQHITCKGGTGEITFELSDTRLSDGDQVIDGFNFTIYDLANNSAVFSGTTHGTTTPGKYQQTGISAGKYRVETTSIITGCKAYATFELIEADQKLDVFAEETHSVTCDGNRAEIMVRVSGGWAPYEITINGAAVPSKILSEDGGKILFTGLSAVPTPGAVTSYTISISDKWGCTVYSGTHEVGIIYPDAISGTITVTQHATCSGSSDGIIQVVTSTITGGSGTYNYTLYRNGRVLFTPEKEESKSATYKNLAPGFYDVEIMDTWGCSLIERQIEIVEPAPITVSVTSQNLQVCYKGRDGSISFHVEGGRPPYTVKVVDKYTNIPYHNESGIYSSTPVNVPNMVGAPPSVASEQLPAGDYRVYITDSGQGTGVGCTMSPTFDFSVISVPDLEASTSQGYNCDNNEFSTWIEVRFKDEIDFNRMTFSLNGSTPQMFSRNNGDSNRKGNIGYIDQTRFDITVATQTMELFYTSVHSATGAVKSCSHTLTNPVHIEEIYQLSEIVKTPTTVVNTLQVEGKDGKKPYKYEFNGEYYDETNLYELKLNDPDYTNPVSGKKLKAVNVVVYDAAGCVRSRTFYEEYFDILIPNFFTPNGDGIYDTWVPINVEKYPQIRISIFDRFGRRLKVLNYRESWDGKYEGNDMPTGDYWYIIEMNDENDDRTFNGNFTLYR